MKTYFMVKIDVNTIEDTFIKCNILKFFTCVLISSFRLAFGSITILYTL